MSQNIGSEIREKSKL